MGYACNLITKKTALHMCARYLHARSGDFLKAGRMSLESGPGLFTRGFFVTRHRALQASGEALYSYDMPEEREGLFAAFVGSTGD